MARKSISLLVMVGLMLALALPSGSAYADGYAGVVYGPKATAVVNPEYGVIVNAGSSFDAALYAIGYSPDSSEFTADVKAYLSNADTGGAFYTFAQKFTNHNDKWGDGGFAGSDGTNVGINDYDLNMTTSLKMFNNMYGPSNVWCGQYSATERVAAVASVGLVLAGGVGGGGSSPDVPEGYTQITGGSVSGYMLNFAAYTSDATFSSFTVDCSRLNTVKSQLDNYENVVAVAAHNSSSNPSLITISLYVYNDGLLFLSKDATVPSGVYYYKTVTENPQYRVVYQFSANVSSSGVTVNGSGGSAYNTPTVSTSNVQLANHSINFQYAATRLSSTPVVPPTNWPETDPTPTPEPPTVDPPTTPDPPNVPTTPTPPTYPPEVTYPDVTYVEADLSAVLDALNEHCEHLQHSIYTASSNLYSSLSSSISGEFTSLKTFMRALMSWNVDAINSNFDALYTYLTDFAVWLEGCIRADDIVLLLEGIYNQMGNLDASTDDLVDLSVLESGVSDISADVELIVQALNNLQDDNDLLTIRGYLKGMYDWLYDLDLSGVGSDLSVLEHQLTDLTDSDNVTLTVRGLLYWINHYMAEVDRVINDVYDELSSFTSDCAQFWADLKAYLDDILDALDNLEITPRVRYTPTNPPEIPDAPDLDADLNVDALRDALSRLMEKFPFSTINNFLLILTLLTRPAQAPVFDLPLPNPSDWSSPYMVNVDLSIWDIPAAVLRTGIVIWAIARVSRRTVSMWTREEGGGQ